MYGIQRHGSLTEAKSRQFTGHATADQHVWRSLATKTAYQEAQGKKFSAKRSGAHATAQGIETLGKEALPLNSTFFTIASLLSRLFHFGRRTRGDTFCSELQLCAAVRRAVVFFSPWTLFFFLTLLFLLSSFRILDKPRVVSIGRSFSSFTNVRRPLQLRAIPPRRLQLCDRKARRRDNQRFHCGGRP